MDLLSQPIMNFTNTSVKNTGFTSIMIAFVTLQQLVFVVACIGNGLVIFIFVHKLTLKSNTNKFVVSLAAADFLTGLVAGAQFFYILFPDLSLNMFSCFLRYQVVSYTTIVSQFTVMVTTLDRFVAICHPHHYSTLMTRRVAVILGITPWITALIFICTPFFDWNAWQPGTPCIFLLLFNPSYYLITSMLIYVCSFVSFVMYLFILRTAWRFYSRVKPTSGEHQHKQQKTQSKRFEKDMRGAKVMAVVTLAFTVCWVPFMVFPLRKGIGIDDTSEIAYNMSNWLVFLGILNSIVNPFIYGWKRQDFSRECKTAFCCVSMKRDGITQSSLEDRGL